VTSSIKEKAETLNGASEWAANEFQKLKVGPSRTGSMLKP